MSYSDIKQTDYSIFLEARKTFLERYHILKRDEKIPFNHFKWNMLGESILITKAKNKNEILVMPLFTDGVDKLGFSEKYFTMEEILNLTHFNL